MRNPSAVLSYLCALISICAVTALTAHGAPPSSNALPPELLAAIRTAHPGGIIMTVKDIADNPHHYAGYDYSHCLCYVDELKSPGLVKADFNGDGLADYAVLLINAGLPRRYASVPGWLVIFTGKKDGGFTPTLNTVASPIDEIIHLKPPGTIKYLDEENSIHQADYTLKNPGVELIYCDKGAVLYYWDAEGNDFKTLTTGD